MNRPTDRAAPHGDADELAALPRLTGPNGPNCPNCPTGRVLRALLADDNAVNHEVGQHL